MPEFTPEKYKFYIELSEGDLIFRGDRWQVLRTGRLRNTYEPKLAKFTFLALLQALWAHLGRPVCSKNYEPRPLLCSNVHPQEGLKLPHVLQCEEHSSTHKFLSQRLSPIPRF
jgi:hypothetical protein